jgi:hypothetical protein
MTDWMRLKSGFVGRMRGGDMSKGDLDVLKLDVKPGMVLVLKGEFMAVGLALRRLQEMPNPGFQVPIVVLPEKVDIRAVYGAMLTEAIAGALPESTAWEVVERAAEAVVGALSRG